MKGLERTTGISSSRKGMRGEEWKSLPEIIKQCKSSGTKDLTAGSHGKTTDDPEEANMG